MKLMQMFQSLEQTRISTYVGANSSIHYSTLTLLTKNRLQRNCSVDCGQSSQSPVPMSISFFALCDF